MLTRVRAEIRKGRYHFRNLGVNERIKIKHLLKNCKVQILIGFV